MLHWKINGRNKEYGKIQEPCRSGRFTGSISAKEFLLFLQEKAQIETINVLKANSQNGELLYSNEFESMQSNALEQAPDTAVTGVYYLDGGQNTNLIFQELQNQILTKNQYAQIVVLEDSSKGYLLERLKNSQDATYYLLQMGLLVLLNLLNFGNVASCWANYRITEIAVRKMVGGTDGTIFRKIMILFGAATGLFYFKWNDDWDPNCEKSYGNHEYCIAFLVSSIV